MKVTDNGANPLVGFARSTAVGGLVAQKFLGGLRILTGEGLELVEILVAEASSAGKTNARLRPENLVAWKAYHRHQRQSATRDIRRRQERA